MLHYDILLIDVSIHLDYIENNIYDTSLKNIMITGLFSSIHILFAWYTIVPVYNKKGLIKTT